MSLVSSVPLRLPTAHTSLVLLQRSRHTTPPLPPLSSDTKFRRNSPVFRSQILTVPSSEDVMTNFLLNCKHVTALWCLFGPETKGSNPWRNGLGRFTNSQNLLFWILVFRPELCLVSTLHMCLLTSFIRENRREHIQRANNQES